jgi:hypothetical protein
MNGEHRKAIHVKGILQRKTKKCNTSWNIKNFKTQRNKVTSMKRKSFGKYLDKNCNKSVDEGYKSPFWQTMEPILTEKCKNSDNISIRNGDDVIVDQGKVCDILNDNFVSAARDIGGVQPVTLENDLSEIYKAYENHKSIKMIKQHMEILGTDGEFSFRPVSQKELYKKLFCLKTNRSCGYDGQPAKLIKAGASILCYTLLPIVNGCFVNSVFPTDLKYAEVTPVYKKEDALNRKNYRPVSVLVCQSKLFEGFMSDQLMTFFANKLSSCLAAYRNGYKHTACSD